ncbi:tRNA uridine-5-carboxymethylaminomethyl(34) synthesis GTPase MnmE [Candidatus Avelusimicrobium gallicola]|uniref:tRNA modification GTPase MnmE n=1 Tax=Candidatus Avelusimicrobium gallicola TaxID=2562704 RepID=A0A1Y4DIU1_9BACT|nr:tRNA uridine-5-carboxymethylaminomethyl(34) synthesis GTPase MnmE [Elusimicrobium sp. An273]OUO56858.1 tRNA uridine-5-carboxymethylaminomethyl(34) synthesis GTPase MnmE [Elusimicrobium sp. An273]
MQHTICALATGAGGAVALVRLSGPEVCRLLAVLTRRPQPPEPRKQALRTIYDGDAVLDKALVTYFQAPHSFTGEDVAEFAVHASPYIKGRLLELLCQNGAVMAKRGEFSQRAFLNGKMDLVEAQGLCDLIASGNKAAHKLAMDSLDGKLSARLEEIKKRLSELLAQIEVRLDDVDEEMTPLSDDFVRGELSAVLGHIKALADTFSVGKYIKDGLKTAIVGAPNSGKSSLLNALVGFDRAIVSDQSGTTRDTVEETLEINGQKIILTDTAGIREHALDPAEKEGMRRSHRAMEAADLILFVLDASRPLTPEEQELWQDIRRQNKRTVLVWNKSDLSASRPTLQAQEQYPSVSVSCKTGDGLNALKDLITADVTEAQTADGLMISNLRHYEALLRAQTELESALIRLESHAGGEIYAEHLRRALNDLQDLIGEVTPDDVLGIIFSKFCMGK